MSGASDILIVTDRDLSTAIEDKANLVDGTVPSGELPSYVDDVLQYSGTTEFPVSGESGKLYIDTTTNKLYRYNGTTYVTVAEDVVSIPVTSVNGQTGNVVLAASDISVQTPPYSGFSVESALVSIGSAKVDKIPSSGSTVGHFVSIGENGTLLDSTKGAADFASYSHTHAIGDVSGLSGELASKANEDAILWEKSISEDSVIQKLPTYSFPYAGSAGNLAYSVASIVEGGGNEAGLKAYRYTNTGTVTNSLTFTTYPSGWEVGDVVSVVNSGKYANAGTIASISGNTVTFTSNLPFSTIVDDSGFDAKCAYVTARPDYGDVDIGYGAHAEGVGTESLNVAAHSEGVLTKAYGAFSHAEGYNTTAQHASHAEGQDTSATGYAAHAEGQDTSATGSMSHAEGQDTSATGDGSHAEGKSTVSSSEASHAEGLSTSVVGRGSHVEGMYTTISGTACHAEGRTNSINSSGASTTSAAHVEGYSNVVTNSDNSHAEGASNEITNGRCSHVAGEFSKAAHSNVFVWNGDKTSVTSSNMYEDHGAGTFNVNPASLSGNDPKTGFFVGGTSLADMLDGKADSLHASSHASGQDDAISPSSIGAADYAFVLNKLAPEFSQSVDYSVGDLVSYNGDLYRCNSTHYGAWNSSHFDSATVDDALHDKFTGVLGRSSTIVDGYDDSAVVSYDTTLNSWKFAGYATHAGSATTAATAGGVTTSSGSGVVYESAGHWIFSGSANRANSVGSAGGDALSYVDGTWHLHFTPEYAQKADYIYLGVGSASYIRPYAVDVPSYDGSAGSWIASFVSAMQGRSFLVYTSGSS